MSSNMSSGRMVLNTNLGGGRMSGGNRHGGSQLESEEGSRGYIDENEEMEDEMLGRYHPTARYEGHGGDV